MCDMRETQNEHAVKLACLRGRGTFTDFHLTTLQRDNHIARDEALDSLELLVGRAQRDASNERAGATALDASTSDEHWRDKICVLNGLWLCGIPHRYIHL